MNERQKYIHNECISVNEKLKNHYVKSNIFIPREVENSLISSYLKIYKPCKIFGQI